MPVELLRVFSPVAANLAGWPDGDRHPVDRALRAMLVEALGT